MVRGGLYSSNELRILWYLKRNGPLIKKGTASLYGVIADGTMLSRNSVRFAVKALEEKCMVLCTWSKDRPEAFGSSRGSVVVRIELIDPAMNLPEPPRPVPQVVIDARENEELYEMTAIEPSPDAVILALLARNEELQDQITRLQDVIIQLQEKITSLSKEKDRKVPEHLTSRIREALTPEQWDALSHSATR